MSFQPSVGTADQATAQGSNQGASHQGHKKKKKEGVNGTHSRNHKNESNPPRDTLPSTIDTVTIKHTDHTDAVITQIHSSHNPRLSSRRGRERGRKSTKDGKHDTTLSGENTACGNDATASMPSAISSRDKDFKDKNSTANNLFEASMARSTADNSHDTKIKKQTQHLKTTILNNTSIHQTETKANSNSIEKEDHVVQTKITAQLGTLNLPSIPLSSLPQLTTDGVPILMTRKNAPPRLAQGHKGEDTDQTPAGVGQEIRSDKNPKLRKEPTKVLKKKKKAHPTTQEKQEQKDTHIMQEEVIDGKIHHETAILTAEDHKISTNEATFLHRSESLVSMKSDKSLMTERDAFSGSIGGNIDLLKQHDQDTALKTDKATVKKKKKVSSTKQSSTTEDSQNPEKEEKTKQKVTRKGDIHDPTNHRISEEMSNQRAARHFNKAVRECVELSDPDGIRSLLHNKRNHSYALNGDVLEMLLKAYVVAAMFEDAVYCLRNCTLPGTLRIEQTEKILQCMPQNLRHSSAFVAADMINALCIATEFEKAVHRTYFMRIVRGIALEFLEEATTARDRICSVPCERLVRSGDCVVDARLKRGKRVTEIVVDPGYQLGVFVPDVMENRGIQAGDAVGILPYAGPYPISAESLDRNMIEATVTGIQPMILRLQDKTNASLYVTLTEAVEGNVYRIDKLANRMGFNRQLAAVVTFCTPSHRIENESTIVHRYDNRRPAAALVKAVTAMDENIDKVMILGGSASRHGRFRELTSTASLCASAVPWNSTDDSDLDGYSFKSRTDEDSLRDAARLALVKYRALEGLNTSQQLAVEGAATNRLTLIQGPPGTGKTAVAIRILQHWARVAASEALPGETPKPIMATSDSNIAVDNLVEGCANAGLRVVRLGRPEVIRSELLKYCIDRPNTSESKGPFESGYGNTSSASAFKERTKTLKSAQVICCTCIGSGSDMLDNMVFERVLVDEATQATEPAVLVPLTRGCRQLVLVGDHCQLPPTVLSTKAEEEGLGVPLFSRMVACGVPPYMLDTQYRCHPGIAMFPSDLFYGGKLLNGVSAPERRPLAGFPWPREEFPVAFVPVPHGIEVDDGVSKLNEAEAAAACDAIAALLAGGQCTVSDIAVVTPYAAQARLIRRLTRKIISGPPFIEVSSTDGFQGREKEAVVFSAVRSNDWGNIGFVSDWRRVNVSFTRARRALIVIGNPETLRRGDQDTWSPWLAWIDAHGLNMDKPGIPRGRYDPEVLRRVRGGTTAAEMLKEVLERQQAQMKTAEKQLQNAEKKAAGHFMGTKDQDTVEDDEVTDNQVKEISTSLVYDLVLSSNTEKNWDDSDDDYDDTKNLQRSVSKTSLATTSSSIAIAAKANGTDDPLDAWDL